MRHYLGIDLGGTNVAMAILDENYHIIKKVSTPTKASRSFEAIVADIALTARNLAGEEYLPTLSFVGAGIPGTIDPRTGRIIFASNLGWRNADFMTEFQKHWNIPLHICNDASCAVLGEAKAGCAVGCENVMLLTLGTGVGGGLILNNQLYHGANGLGCELGHTLFAFQGLPCSCGRQGCVEQYISVTAFKRQTKAAMAAHPESIMHQLVEYNLHKISGKTAFQAKKLGDLAGTQVVDQYTNYIATAIVSLFSAYRIPTVIIGGGISHEGEPLLGPVQKQVAEMISRTDPMEPPRILGAQLGNDAGIIGAALLG